MHTRVAMVFLTLCAFALIPEVELIGRLNFADVLLAGALPLLIAQRGVGALGPRARQFLIFAGLWFLGAVVTDAIRQTPFEDVARGWSKITFFAMNFTSIWLLVDRKPHRIVAFVVLLFVAETLKLYFDIDQSGTGSTAYEGWKYGYGQLLAASCFLLSALLVRYPVTRLAGLSLPFVDAAINLALNARNLFGVVTLSAIINATATGRRGKRLTPAFLIAVSVAAVLGGGAVLSLYSYAASSGMLGVAAKDKYDVQVSGDLGILLGGRNESLATSQAIVDSPIIGHGSWARDVRYVELMVSRLEEAGYEVQGAAFTSDVIPTHSHLAGAWVEAGILGAVFWLWAL